MNGLRRLWAFLVVDFTGLVRDRTALFFIVILPLAFVFGIGIVSGGAQTSRLPLGLVVADESAQADSLAARLTDHEGIAVTALADETDLQEEVAGGRFVAGLVVPAGYGARIAGGAKVTLVLYEGGSGSTQVARAAVGSLVADLAAEVTAARFAVAAGAEPDAAAAAASALAPRVDATITVETQSVSGTPVYQAGFTSAAYTSLILFMTITAVTSAGTIAERKEQGVARRSLVTPATRSELVVGFTAARLVLILATGLLLVVATRLLFAVRWGDLVAVGAVLVAYSAVCVGLVAVVGTMYRTSSQAGSIGPWIGIVMGMLGGCMWPLAIVPPFMQVVGHLVPTAWGVDALQVVVLGGGGVTDISRELAVLAGFAVVLLTVGIVRFRRSMVHT